MNASLARFIVLIGAVFNSVLNAVGFQTIPDEFFNDLIAVISGAYFLYMAWKNNYLSRKGRRQKKVLEDHELT